MLRIRTFLQQPAQPHQLWRTAIPSEHRAYHRIRAHAMKDRQSVIKDFKEVVNMSAPELEEWLQTDESNKVGWKEDSSEAVGHQSGRRIVEILGKLGSGGDGDDGLDDDDIGHMSKVVGYVHRHKAQAHRMTNKSEDELEHTRWTSSLRNWGHDPLKDQDVLEQVGAQ